MLVKRFLPFLVHLFLLINICAAATITSSPSPSPSPHTGNQQENDDDFCSDYKTCGQKGLTYWNKLHDTLADPNTRDRTDSLEIFKEYYTATFEETAPADADIHSDILQRGLDADYFDEWSVMDNTPGSQNKYVPYTNHFNTQSGIIIAKSNFRNDDRAKQLPWSEIIYQTWHQARIYADHESLYGIKPHSPGGPLSNLQSVIQMICVNVQTQTVIRTLYDAMGWRPEGDAQWRKWTEEEQPYFFFALLGTDNVKGTVYLLNDHADEVGRKTVTVIWTRWDFFAPDVWVDVG
ncbi:MAG: hypothetical protein Q9222_001820 [Ikaeria aurantiellina]